MPIATTTENAYELALQNFDAAADAMGLDNDVRTMIKYPERVLTVSVPVRLDDGHIHRFEAYRVQHSSVARPRQGRHPLPSPGHSRRGQGAGHLDDLEMRGGEHPLRRRARAESPATPSTCRNVNWSA